MALSKTYKIVEFDANDVPTVYKTGLTRSAARELDEQAELEDAQ
jgi:hypothetical protein